MKVGGEGILVMSIIIHRENSTNRLLHKTPKMRIYNTILSFYCVCEKWLLNSGKNGLDDLGFESR
jgi:hypothetical protein